MSSASSLDQAGVERVTEMIDAVRATGLVNEAEMFSTVCGAWWRIASAYVNAHPYVERPEPGGMTPFSALTIVDFTFRHWCGLVPGTPKLDDERVRREADDDEAWHREEDRRMRRAAGEDIP